MDQPAKIKKPSRPVIVACVVLIPLLWLAGTQIFDIRYRPIEVTGTIQAKEVPIASKVGGRIAKVHVHEGQEVKAGDVIVEFEVPEIEARRGQLLADIEQAKASLQEMKHGPRPAEIARARAQAANARANYEMLRSGYRQEDILKASAQRAEAEANLSLLESGYRSEEVEKARNMMEQAKVKVDWQRQDWERYKGLSVQGAVSTREANELKSRFDAAKEEYEATSEEYRRLKSGPRKQEIAAARKRLDAAVEHENMLKRGPRVQEVEMAHQQYNSALESLRLLEQGTRKEQIDQAQARLQRSQAQLAEVEAQLKERVVTAPANAEVSVMDLHPGSVIAAGKSIATLTKLDDLWTRVYIPERELSRVRMGQEVTLIADAYPKRKFPGRIVQIPSTAEFTPRNVQTAEERSAQVFGLKVQIDNKDHALRGGMNAEITLPPVEGPFVRLARKEDAVGDKP